MTKRLRFALAGVVFVAALGLNACDMRAQADGVSPAQDAINQAFGPIADQATRVADCESGMDPNAISSGGGNYGLFQINYVHSDAFQAFTGQPYHDGALDPYANAAYAKHLYDESGGWGPWSCRWAA
ncbi:MAG TPA: transglycosylase SLT domain-containing protein [Acidimicrobiales bacterium]|nr:transglycosylase SLT domain-containing protein [Acidimicrobiales bacterium]